MRVRRLLAALVIGLTALLAPSVIGSPPSSLLACSGGYYENSDGNCIQVPTQAPSAPPGASARCDDGSYSFSQHRSGTCSGHGGVNQWL